MANAAIFIIIVPMLTAVVITLLDVTRWRAFSGRLALLSLGTAVGLALLLTPQILRGERLVYTLGSWERLIGISLLVDRLSIFMVLLGNLLGLLVLMYALAEGSYQPRFYTLLLIMLSALSGAFLSRDIFNLFVFMEVLSIASYILVAHYGGPGSYLAGVNYLLISSIGLIFFLFAIGVLYRYTGALNMVDLSAKIPDAFARSPRALVVAAALLTIAFGIKSAMLPLHTWLPDAHSIAPSPVSALLSGIVIKVGIYGFFRTIRLFRLCPLSEHLAALLLYVGAATAVFGALMALVQTDLKRLLAYSSINQIGYMLIGIGVGTAGAMNGALFHTVNHALAKSCLFLCAGLIIEHTGKRKIAALGGAARQLPGITAIFILAALSLIGIPPAGGFFSKLMIGLASAQSGHPLAALVIFGTSIITGAYFLRCISVFFQAEAEHFIRPKSRSYLVYLPLLLLTAGVFGVILLPGMGGNILNAVAP
jgi:multicomponent Na+:H+ antiporter subunit D